MSASPPKETDVEPAAQSPGNSEHMERDPQDPQAHGLAYEFEVKEQDRWLPIANVARIMKTALPENAKIAKEAKECMQECVSEFISFITSEGPPPHAHVSFARTPLNEATDPPVAFAASEKCQQEKRKTVNGEDILFAMTSLGFENYAEALKIYLAKYRETQSARGENQNRPGSSYGSGGPVGGGGSGPSSTGAGPNASSAPAYHGQPESSNNILSPHGMDASEHDNGGYGNVYPTVVGVGHNGAVSESY